MKVALYARVSTKDQTIENQLLDLRRFATARGLSIVVECTDVGVSGRKEKRHGLDEVIRLARSRQIDGVVVAGFDRFGRSLSHLVRTLEEFQALGVGFVSLREQVDLGTPTGRLMFALIGAMAEFERSLIVERINAGLRRARAQGKRPGRKPRVFRRDQVEDLRAAGLSWREIGRQLRVNYNTARRAMLRNPAAEATPNLAP